MSTRSTHASDLPCRIMTLMPVDAEVDVKVYRVDVEPIAGEAATKLYLIETAESADRVRAMALPLLADGVRDRATFRESMPAGDTDLVEVWPKPGVMDPAAGSVEEPCAAAVSTSSASRPAGGCGARASSPTA